MFTSGGDRWPAPRHDRCHSGQAPAPAAHEELENGAVEARPVEAMGLEASLSSGRVVVDAADRPGYSGRDLKLWESWRAFRTV